MLDPPLLNLGWGWIDRPTGGAAELIFEKPLLPPATDAATAATGATRAADADSRRRR